MRVPAVLLFLLSVIATAAAQTQTWKPLRPVSTFSIVARDPQTGEMGVAVQSHWFAVGQIVPWAEAGVGAVATQSFVDPSYGKLGLDLMRAGKSAPEALKALMTADPSRAVRQVAMVDAEGRTAAFTGCKDIQAAGHAIGADGTTASGSLGPVAIAGTGWVPEPQHPGEPPCNGVFTTGSWYSAQANLMSNDKIWLAMSQEFESTKGDLAERMLAALDAAQAVGGDIRGRQSAALIVVKAKSSGKSWEDRIFDLRVDDNPEPLKELRRLVTLQRAYNHMNAGDLAVEHKDNEGALREYSAAEQLATGAEGIPSSRLAEMIYWHAVALVKIGKVDESLPLFRKAFTLQPSWRELTPRLPKAGLLPDDPKLIETITKQ